MKIFLRTLCLVVFITCANACGSEQKDEDRKNGDKKETTNSEQQKVSETLNRVGKVNLHELETKAFCNFYSGHYYLDKPFTDTSDLAVLAKHLGTQVQSNAKPQPDCNLPLKSAAHLYMTKADCEQRQRSIASCYITEEKPQGEVFLNTFNISQYK